MNYQHQLKLQAEFLFEFRNFTDWVNNASKRFRPYKYGYHTIAVDTNGMVCHIGQDFMIARDEKLFPIKVYALQRSHNKFSPSPILYP
jgi:hypothetical protein